MGIGAQVRGWRQQVGLTQKQLAERAAMSVAAIRDLEQGRVSHPYPDSARRLAAALGLNAEQRAHLANTARGLAGAGTVTTGRQVIGNSLSATGGLLPNVKVSGDITAKAPYGLDFQISVLGPLRVWRQGAEVPVGGSGSRTILALLATHPNSLVTRGTIIYALWGDDPPASAVAMVQTYVSRLRSAIGLRGRGRARDAALPASDAGGYRLRATEDQLDLLAFGQHAERARRAAAMGDYRTACHTYDEALRLWRGEPLGNIGPLHGHAAIDALLQRRAAVVMDFAEVACFMGRHDRVLPYLQQLITADSLNERAHAWLMIALAGSGQQAAALAVYERVRQRLDEQLGLAPGADLVEAQARVLRQDIAQGLLPRFGT